LSFWLPEDATKFNSNDFFDIVRQIGGDLVEQVELIDVFENKKTKKKSHCYRIVYRSIDRVLSQSEVNILHKRIEKKAVELLNVVIR
jgi:phenylalanyl-tRNA synthetase alpha chain